MEFDVSALGIAFAALAFLVAGVVDAIAGGGGLITLPALLLTGLPAHAVLGTGKLAGSLGSMSAAIAYFRKGLATRRLLPLGFAAAFLGSAAGSWLALQIAPALLGRVLVFLLPVALVLSIAFVRKSSAEPQISFFSSV